MSRLTVDHELPRLVINYPTCSHCGNDVQIEDDAAWCDTCLVQWGSIEDGEISTPDENLEGSEVPCEIVEPDRRDGHEYDYNGEHWTIHPKQPCILPSGHEGEHLCPHDIETSPL
ncbi:hypothetical protein [Nocardioides jejuensis]|uniref:Uncharacterized protein n=1 Tax=Nocardioides jejuensis TaxID=2502782 RepID=A0A4R1BYA3_9ACTN|nr:hypothetical protein [Nocardioides jejuensis]TCJ23043.1 hypothetical protein EPD65_11820 [Nocardioides jejuensis]